MSQILSSGNTALQSLEKGITKLASAVKITLGPKGQNVIIDQNGSPLITNDGVTIAKAIILDDPIENMGANILKSVSIKTNDLAGDGTTTACVLAEAMVKNGLKNYIAGADPLQLRTGMQLAVEKVVEYLDKIAIPVSSTKDIYQIASISAGSPYIGQLISQAFQSIGIHGTITIEDSKTTKTECQVVAGYSFDRGYLSPYFCNQEKLEVKMTNPLLLFCHEPIHKIQQILKALELSNSLNRPLCIIASDIDQEVLQALIVNKLRGTLNITCVKAPDFGDRQKSILEDMAIAHQGKVIGAEYDTSYDQLDASYFGTCATLTMTSDHTILVGQQESQQLQARINQIQSQLDETSGIDQYLLELRLSKLTGGIAVIRVGGATEIEQNELKLRIEDSINATKSATKEGIVAGGGTTLLKAREYIKEWIDTLQDDVRLGATIIYDSLKQPLLQICANGHVHGEVILDKIAQSQLDNAGYDASTGKIVNMIETGILDPKKVTRCALQNACSVASTMLTTQCVITSTPTQSSK